MLGIGEGLRLKGLIDIYDQDGRLLQHVENLITDVGLQQLTKWLALTDTKTPTHIAVGTGTNAPANGDTALQTEVARQATDTPSVYSIYYARWITTFPTTVANVTLKEVGLLDDPTTGNLWARAAINVTKTSSIALTVDWKWQITRV